MIIRHATPRQNLESIKANGLDPEKSRGARKAVWIHSSSKTPWALLHTQMRHGVKLEEIVVIEVEIPKSWLTRHHRGLWYCGQIIEWSRVLSVKDATEWAASPVKE